MNNLIDVMAWKFKGCSYSCGENYESLVWREETTKPTLEELELYAAEYESYKQNTAYRQQRANEYPGIPEQLDLLYHQGYDGWRNVIGQIKAKYPKGE